VPSCAINNHNGIGSRYYLRRDLVEMELHGFGVAARKYESGPDTARRTDSAEYPDRFRALVLGCRGPGSSLRPAPHQFGLLTDPGFILPPDFYVGVGREPSPDRLQLGGEVFLKSSTANSFCPRWRGRAVSLQNPNARSWRPTVVSSSEMPYSSHIHRARILETPAHYTVDRHDRPLLDNPVQARSVVHC